MLDAVVLSGGEPTLHPGLPDVARMIKNAGLEVKLDTNGTNPEMLELMIGEKLLDYVAMDIKAPLVLADMQRLTGPVFSAAMLEKISESIEVLEKGSVNTEYRTTVLKSYHTREKILRICNRIPGTLYLQNFRPLPGVQNPDLQPVPDMTEFNCMNETKTIIIRSEGTRKDSGWLPASFARRQK
jgi:pyruvate formate lyase activating enzyme